MSPTKSIPGATQHKAPRHGKPRAIVPAIPLPYLQKQKQQLAAKEKAKEEATKAEAQVVVPAQEPESTPTPPRAEVITPVVVNGSSTEEVQETVEDISEQVEAIPSADDAVPELELAPTNEDKEDKQEQTEEVQEEKLEEQIEPAASLPSEPPSSASRSTFHMPPPFVPANHNSSNNTAASVKFPPPHQFNGHHSVHHAHPSTGSLMFGGYPDSNNSSPAPPPSAGNVPPYPFQQPHTTHHGPHLSNGNHPQHVTNGYSQMGPSAPPGYLPRPDNFASQGPTGDNYARRHMISFAPPNDYSPSPTPLGFEQQPPYDPSTPHSFHGSQSSAAPNEQEGGSAFYGQYPTAVISNGTNGHIDDVRLYQQRRSSKQRAESQHLTPAQSNYPVGQPQVSPPQQDNLDGLHYYLQNQFADAELADYVLELRYSDDHAPPVRIPGHNLMFARSPTLKSLMKAQSQESNGLNVKSLFIESDDRFLRSDGFWMAVQRLYGGPLLDLGAAALRSLPRNAGQSGPIAGTPAERFDLALGYVAAGHILCIPPVVNRGIEIAGLLVNWDTIEKALDFAIDGGLDNQWTFATQQENSKTPSTYGPGVNILIFSALNFLIQAFPPNFDLDTSVGEPSHNRRLPKVPDVRPAAPNPRLSFIKFGDHPSADAARSDSGNSISASLSKILLNLPFHLLKYVLESPRLGNVEGWANNTLRQRVMHTVVDEREKRRLRVVQSTYSSEQAKDTLDDSVHWQEAVVLHNGPEGTPTLTRSWAESPVSVTSN